MPPKPVLPTSAAASNPAPVNPATTVAAPASTATTSKKAPVKRKSSTGSTDSKPTVKKKKTTAKAAKPGTASAKAIISKVKDNVKPPNADATTKGSSLASPKTTAAKTATSKTASPAKSTTSKTKAKTTSIPTQLSKLQKAQQLKKDLANLESIEQAFRQDREVWCPKEPSAGWMYRTGAAGLGCKVYMKAADESGTNKPDQKPGLLFDEAALLKNALGYNNLTSDALTPSAYTALLEQARRYALELLVDAQDYAQHASRSTVASLTPADVTLAAEMRGDANGVSSTLPKFEDMAEYASEINIKPLPPIPADCYNGVALPPLEEQLTRRTFDIVNGARIAQKMMKGGDLPLSSVNVALEKRSVNVDHILSKKADAKTVGSKTNPEKSSYGAGKGRQIAIHLKDKGSADSSTPKKSDGKDTKSTASKRESKNKRKLTEL